MVIISGDSSNKLSTLASAKWYALAYLTTITPRARLYNTPGKKRLGTLRLYAFQSEPYLVAQARSSLKARCTRRIPK